mmetsp:Transcript_102761/g.329538  ORF Transcript_102761/g.329538 Transcript_102761/m.329538 type:complete len:103 (+) Transcript_102761:984-1292(+)
MEHWIGGKRPKSKSKGHSEDEDAAEEEDDKGEEAEDEAAADDDNDLPKLSGRTPGFSVTPAREDEPAPREVEPALRTALVARRQTEPCIAADGSWGERRDAA